MGKTMILKIAYFAETDTLSLWNGTPASEAGDLIASGALDINGDTGGAVTGDIIADYDSVGRVVGFTIEHAAELLLHPLARRGGASQHLEIEGMYAGYRYTLLMNNGTLTLSSDRDKVRSSEVAEHLTAHYDADGDAAGFTLKHAAELLLPLLEGAPDDKLVGSSTDGQGNSRREISR